jgi:hypothetical protein
MEVRQRPCVFVYIEHFIEEGVNWAVFERNRALSGTTSVRRNDATK